MATPDNYELMKKFKYIKSMKQGDYLPLMQSNDVFIISAIAAGLINEVIWVQPDWNDNSNITRLQDAYVGEYFKKKMCYCTKRLRRKPTPKTPYRCSVAPDRTQNNDGEDDDDVPAVHIQESQCKKLNRFRFHVVSESKFKNVFKFRKSKNIIIDIDEDFYGVESGVKRFIEQGISLRTQELLDSLFSDLYCPTSTSQELELHRSMQNLFQEVFHLRRTGREQNLQQFQHVISKHTKHFMCRTSLIGPFSMLIANLDITEVQALLKARFCLFNSPRLNENKEELGFALCHGTIYPADKLNKIHVGTLPEIDQRAALMKRILFHVNSFVKPSIYTICRSLRDGYTPREQQRYIERNVLQVATEVIRKNHQKEYIVYDSQLVYGKQGWVNDII